jgi:ribosomal protein S15
MGDPVRSNPTPFIESLRPAATPQDSQIERVNKEEEPATSQSHLNFFLTTKELENSLAHSKYLTEPLPPGDVNSGDPSAREQDLQEHLKAHENAQRALAAIAALENGSSKDRTRVNIQRCIEEFGRHKTDRKLAPKPASMASPAIIAAKNINTPAARRVGPDTGSSEVQAAILTTKITTLADNLGKKDKHNKRNLRVLVHKRQKLLSYLRRKERGGPRWQHLVEKLGISDAMWKGEISL